MADSMCGPSNALQNFQKHSTVDRTLQQERLVARSSASQGFRSSSPRNAGQLDAELEAFQAGQPSFEPHGFQQHPFSAAPQNFQQPGQAAWAADFQRMNLSSPPPQFQQQPLHLEAAQQRSGTAGWHQDFAQQFQQQPMSGQPLNQMGNSTYRYSPMSGMGMGMGSQLGMGYTGAQADVGMVQQQQPVEAYDEEAFARAFEEASKSEIDSKQDLEQKQDLDLGQEILINESAERLIANEERVEQGPRIGADLIHDPASQDQRNLEEQSDPDALARTAAQLLDTLKTNKTSKFQNSQFLGLMRQLRDKEAWVDGDKIVGVNSAGGGNETVMTPETAQTNLSA